MDISDKLKTLRKEKGLTQKKLAELSGVSENAIKQYEGNKRTPRIEQLKLLADALDTTTAHLLGVTVFHEKQAEVLNNLTSSNFIKDGEIRTAYQQLLVSLERFIGKFPHDEEDILTIMSRMIYMIEHLYLKTGGNDTEAASDNLHLLDDLTRKICSLITRDISFPPLEDLAGYNALAQQDILDINILLNDILKNRILLYVAKKDSDN